MSSGGELLRGALAAVVATILLLAGCFSTSTKAPEKSFPGGDPYEIGDPSISPADELPPAKDKGKSDEERNFAGVRVPGLQERDGLVLSMSIETKTVRAGEPVDVYLILRNMTSTAKRVRFGSEQRFDVAVFADPGQKKLIHLWSADRAFAQIYHEQMLGPGSHLARTLEIPTTSRKDIADLTTGDNSKPLTPGTYYFWGMNAGDPGLGTGPVEVTVR